MSRKKSSLGGLICCIKIGGGRVGRAKGWLVGYKCWCFCVIVEYQGAFPT